MTVDCGITANHEAALCRELGIDLVITDHHECKSELPQAIALVDPHRKDQPQPVTEMAGVGVAFKLAAAIEAGRDFIMQSVLATTFARGAAPDGAVSQDWDLNGKKAVLSVRKA